VKQIITQDSLGVVNGWLLPLWHVDSRVKVDQVYLTVVAPGARKGPHLHMKRCGRFICIKGNVKIRTLENGEYQERLSGEAGDYAEIYVHPGVPSAIYNLGDCDAYVINLPAPPWRAEERDDWPVEGWQ